MRRRELRGAEKRTKGCGEEKTLYFGATVLWGHCTRLLLCPPPLLHSCTPTLPSPSSSYPALPLSYPALSLSCPALPHSCPPSCTPARLLPGPPSPSLPSPTSGQTSTLTLPSSTPPLASPTSSLPYPASALLSLPCSVLFTFVLLYCDRICSILWRLDNVFYTVIMSSWCGDFSHIWCIFCIWNANNEMFLAYINHSLITITITRNVDYIDSPSIWIDLCPFIDLETINR